jgi:cytosine/adenosine deaminase-related metal-dependent hydrolase
MAAGESMSRAAIALAVLTAVLEAFGCAGTAPPASSSFEPASYTGAQLLPGVDRDTIATRIATLGAAVQVGDLVRIDGGAEDVAFMERIAVAVAAAGGHPLVTVFSGETLRRWYEQVPERFDTMRDEWLWRISQSADVEVRVGSLDPAAYAAVEPSRLDAWGRANAGAGTLRRERDVRVVYVGNGSLSPSDWRARMLGIERSELDRIFHEGLMADPARLAAQGLYDVVILDGRVMDPESGLDGVRNVGIRGGTIRIITEQPIDGRTALDARGLVVAPGFIDLNQLSHAPDAQRAKILDGVTAGFAMMQGARDVDDWYADLQGTSLIHFGAAVGHLRVRRTVLAGSAARDTTESGAAWTATTAEIARIRRGVEHGLARGALGVGLELGDHDLGTSPWEVIEVFRAAAAFPGAPVHAALRKTRDHWLETGEAFLAALATGAPLHITGMGNFFGSDAPRLFELIGAARARGLDITTEAYPYVAGAAPFADANYAGWETWPEDAFERFSLPATGEILTRDSFGRNRAAGGLVLVALNTEENLRWVLASSPAMIVSFGELHDGVAHPRLAGTYARMLGHYVREEGVLTLMDALRRMTLLPAQRLEARAPTMRNKGRIRVGADADITIFDPETVLDRATYSEPLLPSAGIRFVLVDGVLVVNEGVLDPGVAPGRAIRAPIRAPIR